MYRLAWIPSQSSTCAVVIEAMSRASSGHCLNGSKSAIFEALCISAQQKWSPTNYVCISTRKAEGRVVWLATSCTQTGNSSRGELRAESG